MELLEVSALSMGFNIWASPLDPRTYLTSLEEFPDACSSYVGTQKKDCMRNTIKITGTYMRTFFITMTE